MNDNFEIFLKKKRIDSDRFHKERPSEWEAYQKLFEQMGPKSFDHQKKFFFNPLRLSFPYQEALEAPHSERKKLRKKPRLLPKQSGQADRSTISKKKGLPKLKPKLSPSPKKPLVKPSSDHADEDTTN